MIGALLHNSTWAVVAGMWVFPWVGGEGEYHDIQERINLSFSNRANTCNNQSPLSRTLPLATTVPKTSLA